MGAGNADALWLEAFGRLADTVAHEIRNPLNGALVNVEVVRQRSARAAGEATSLAPFAASAAAELGRVAELIEAFISLARPVQPPVDLWPTLRSLTLLSGAVASRGGGRVTAARVGTAPPVRAPLAAVRLALAAALESAARPGTALSCTLRGSEEGAWIDVVGGEEESGVAASVRQALSGHGISLSGTAGALTLFFAPGRDGPL